MVRSENPAEEQGVSLDFSFLLEYDEKKTLLICGVCCMRRSVGIERLIRALAMMLAVLTVGLMLPRSEQMEQPDAQWYHEPVAVTPSQTISNEEREILPLASGPFSGGSGTSGDPYLVATVTDLKNLSSYNSSCFRQICDISLGNNRLSWGVYTFSGSYDGGGFSISGGQRLYDTDVLFLSNQGTIKNLHIKDAQMTCTQSVYTGYPSLLVQKNYGTIENCSVAGSISVNGSERSLWMYAAGLAAVNYSTIKNCKNDASVTMVSPDGTRDFAGGITGYNTGTIKNCLNTGEICLNEGWLVHVGGIAGYNEGKVTGCKNTGSIYGCTNYYNNRSGDNEAMVGGIVGHNKGTVAYGENEGNVEAEGASVGRHAFAGGVIGYNGGAYADAGPYVVEYSKNSGRVEGHSNNGEGRAGGITGTCYKNSYVRYCCNTGSVNATNSGKSSLTLGGGIAGALQYGTIMQCCNHGDVYVTSENYTTIGCGLADASDGVFADCYNEGNIHCDYIPVSYSNYGILAAFFYDNGTSCQNCYNLGDITSVSSSNRKYGLYADRGGYDQNTVNNCFTTCSYRVTKAGALITEVQAKQQETFTGYDFTRIWGIDPNVNGGHPYLRAIPTAGDPNWYRDPNAGIPVTGVSLDKTSLTMNIGGTAQLRATVLPVDAKNKAVVWESSKPSVVSVDDTGRVRAHDPGTAIIIVQTEDGGFRANCTVKVTSKSPSFSGGSGTADDPYLIANAVDLQNIIYRKSACYLQVADISLEGMNFLPIGTTEAPFTGVYDGNKCLITDLILESAEQTHLGLFGASSGVVRNVLMADCTVIATSSTGRIYCGALVAYNTGSISGCTVMANLSANTAWEEQDVYVGGLCGYSATAPENCAFGGTVHGKVSYLDSTVYAGGIAGVGNGAKKCRNYGRISAVGALDCDVYAGGILSYANGPVSDCYNVGSVSASESRYAFAGGITGLNADNITACRNDGDIYSATAYAGSSDDDPTPPEGALAVLLGGPEALAGGITGSNFATLTYGENSGLIHAESTSSSAYAGGIVGYNNGKAILQYSKNSGEVRANSTAGESRAGGVASSSHMNSMVADCCNTADIYITNNGMYNTGCAGGVLAVLQYGTAERCCSHGDVYIDSEIYEPHAAAIIGSCTDAWIYDCYSDGDVISNYEPREGHWYGVICGISGGNGTEIRNCYFTGNLIVNRGRSERWGLIKTWGGTANSLSNCYTMNLYSSSGSAMTEAQSTQQSTYAGFDFNRTWAINPNINGGRPYLRSLPSDTADGWYDMPESGDRITSSVYRIDHEYLSGISAGITMDALRANIHQQDVRVQRTDGRILAPQAAIATGMTLQVVENGRIVHQLTLVVNGDVNGDSVVTETDLTAVQSHLLKSAALSGAAERAADINGNGTVTITDLVQLQSGLLGLKPLGE